MNTDRLNTKKFVYDNKKEKISALISVNQWLNNYKNLMKKGI